MQVAYSFLKLRKESCDSQENGVKEAVKPAEAHIPTSILLIKVITLRSESANLILIDVKLGSMAEEKGVCGGGSGLVQRLEVMAWRGRIRSKEGGV